jgi:UDP-glucuronate 4-epimerase
MKKILVTGAAGFIGFHLSKALIDLGHEVFGIDNLNDYYDVNLKKDRLNLLMKEQNFHFFEIDLADDFQMNKLSNEVKFEIIVNLAAQAGVQYSISNPHVYIDSNIRGFLNILELSKKIDVEHLIYASSSSVYGLNETLPFSENDNVDHPISLYAATKKSNELMAHTYSYLFNLPTTGLRFFTVYGPWGRPDMALFKFTKALVEGQKISINNFGNHARDFTYVSDIVNGILSVIKSPFAEDTQVLNLTPSESTAKWRVLNIGRGEKVELMDFITCIENYFNKEIQKEFLPLQPGDVPVTFCNTDKLKNDFSYNPIVSVEQGVKNFLDWYVEYFKVRI